MSERKTWVVSWIVNSRAMGWHMAGMNGIPDRPLSQSFDTEAKAKAWGIIYLTPRDIRGRYLLMERIRRTLTRR